MSLGGGGSEWASYFRRRKFVGQCKMEALQIKLWFAPKTNKNEI